MPAYTSPLPTSDQDRALEDLLIRLGAGRAEVWLHDSFEGSIMYVEVGGTRYAYDEAGRPC